MQKKLVKNKKALSSLALILLLLISAIIGGLISYLWVMGYYISLKEKIPEENTATITNLSFNPQNATAFNVTILNPSFSPDDTINVTAIAISGEDEGKFNVLEITVPTLPFLISRGDSETFTCRRDWSQYVNQTVIVSVFVENGTGSISSIKLPSIQLLLENSDSAFNPILGVRNFTLTFKNDPLSATYLNITNVSLRVTPPVNFTTLMQPTLPFTLFPNSSNTFTCSYNWLNESRIGGSYSLDVETLQGYRFTYPVPIPKLAFSVQEINFNPADTTHFNVTVQNQVSTNTYLNVSKSNGIVVILEDGTKIDVTPPSLNPSTNGVLGNSTATFICAWNWTNYRNKNVIVTVSTSQGISASGQQSTSQAVLLSIPEEPVFPDTQHFFVKVKNSGYPRSIKPANVTKITVNIGTNEQQVPIEQPSSGPYLIGINETTMFSCSWDWSSLLNQSVTIFVYTNETSTYNIFRITRTPANASNFLVYLSIPSAPTFNATNPPGFNVTIHNSQQSNRNATITRITVLLENGTEIDATFTSQVVAINSTITLTCGWDWTTYRNKSVVIRVYTDEGLRAIYITKTPP